MNEDVRLMVEAARAALKAVGMAYELCDSAGPELAEGWREAAHDFGKAANRLMDIADMAYAPARGNSTHMERDADGTMWAVQMSDGEEIRRIQVAPPMSVGAREAYLSQRLMTDVVKDPDGTTWLVTKDGDGNELTRRPAREVLR